MVAAAALLCVGATARSGNVPIPKYELTVALAGAGTGRVTSDPFGIDCGTTCTAKYDAVTSVSLTATAAAGSKFVGWSGDCSGTGTCTLGMGQARAVTATFDRVAPPPVECVVPNVKGKPLAAAERKIAAGHCETGRITHAKSKTVKKGSVVSQKPRPGAKLAEGSKVSLVVSRGRR